MSLTKRKKAIMGIGTLIIFIATILVAAVAAGVLISTSGQLQQRALITGQEARKKITNAIEVVSVVAYGDKVEESLNNFEIMIRLDAGSEAIQMKKFDITFVGPTQHAGAKLAHPSLNYELPDDFTYISSTFYENVSSTIDLIESNFITLWDMDGDNKAEILTLRTIDGISYLVVNFTDSDVDYGMVSLGRNISTPTVIELVDEPIVAQDGYTYGYMHGFLNITVGNQIPFTNADTYLEISKYYTGKCDFDTLPAEQFFCFEVLHGNQDVVLGDGEVFLIKFKLKDDNKMYIGQEFNFLISSEKGRMTRVQARTPDIIQTIRVSLWPVG
jgi:archaellin